MGIKFARMKKSIWQWVKIICLKIPVIGKIICNHSCMEINSVCSFLVLFPRLDIWATSWEYLFLPYVNNKGAHQPAHPQSLISTFVVHCLDSIITCLIQVFKTLAGLCNLAGWLESYLLANPEDRVYRDEAHFRATGKTVLEQLFWQ